MKPARILAFLAIASIAAVTTVACGVSVGSDPTPEVTPTVIPINLVTADPATEPDAFKASLTAGEAACFDEKMAGLDISQDQLQQSLSDSPELLGKFTQMGGVSTLQSLGAFATLPCYSESTAQRVYIGQVSRLAGGLSNATVNCMVEHTNNSSISGLFSDDEAVQRDAMQADNLVSLLQSVFCLGPDERTALETSLSAGTDNARTGTIDGLECAFDYQDGDGRFVVQDAIALFSNLAELDSSQSTDSFPPQLRELVSSMFDLAPVAVDCGLITDEDLADSNLTTDQLICASDSLRDPVMELMNTMADGSNSEPDFGTLAALLLGLDKCGISLDDLGMSDLLGSTGSNGPSNAWGPIPGLPDTGTPAPGQDFSLDDLHQYLSDEQIACLVSHITPGDMQKLMEAGQPPADMFAIMGACNITIDQFISGF